MGRLEEIMWAFTLIMTIWLLLTLVGYICNGLFMHCIAKANGISSSWLSWVPCANKLYLGYMTGELSHDDGFTILYIAGTCVGWAGMVLFCSMWSPLIAIFCWLSLVFSLGLRAVAHYKLYSALKKDVCLLMTILSLFGGIRQISYLIFAANREWYDPRARMIKDRERQMRQMEQERWQCGYPKACASQNMEGMQIQDGCQQEQQLDLRKDISSGEEASHEPYIGCRK